MGAFDDLIPQQNTGGASSGGAFDDLIPKKPEGDPVARVVGQGVRGVNQALYGAPAALMDMAALPFEGSAALTNALGLSSGPSAVGETLRAGAKGLRAAPDAIANAGGAALGIAPQNFEPQTRSEKIANKVGEYTGNVLSTLLPAAGVSRFAAPGTVTQGVAQSLASQPGAQLAAGAIGGATEGYTDSPIAGLAASLATPLGLSAARRSLTPVGNRLSDQENRLIAAAQAENIPLTPAQITGNPTLKTAEATMASLPLSSGPMERTFRGQPSIGLFCSAPECRRMRRRPIRSTAPSPRSGRSSTICPPRQWSTSTGSLHRTSRT